MKKNIFIVSILFSASVTVFSPLHGAHSNLKGRLADREPVEEKVQPSGCLPCCFINCCGCSGATAERTNEVLGYIGAGVNKVIETFAPPVILQIYVLCKNAAYYASEGVMMILNRYKLLDEYGRLKPDAKRLFLEQIGLDTAGKEARFRKTVLDLMIRYPQVIPCLKKALRDRSIYNIPDMTVSLLSDEYELTEKADGISLKDIQNIVLVVDQLLVFTTTVFACFSTNPAVIEPLTAAYKEHSIEALSAQPELLDFLYRCRLIKREDSIKLKEVELILLATHIPKQDTDTAQKTNHAPFRGLFGCCSTNTRPERKDRKLARTQFLRTFLAKTKQLAPDIFRSLLVYCKNVEGYKFPPTVLEQLQTPDYLLTDSNGSLRKPDIEIILELMPEFLPSSILDGEDWVMSEKVIDFRTNFPQLADLIHVDAPHQVDITYRLPATHWYCQRCKAAVSTREQETNDTVLAVLHYNYKLIAHPDTLTPGELAMLLAAIRIPE